jgi:hypothetical protein
VLLFLSLLKVWGTIDFSPYNFIYPAWQGQLVQAYVEYVNNEMSEMNKKMSEMSVKCMKHAVGVAKH